MSDEKIIETADKWVAVMSDDATTVPAAKMRAVAAGFARQANMGHCRLAYGDCAWILNGVLDELGAVSEAHAPTRTDWQAFADMRTQLARLHGLDSSASLESLVDELTKLPTPPPLQG